MQLKAKFGSGNRNFGHSSTDGPNQKNWKSQTNLNISDHSDGMPNRFISNGNDGGKEGKPKVAFTPPSSRKTGGIGLRWEMQHSQDSSTFPGQSISSWKKNVFSKSHSNIQDLAVDDKRGFVPSEVAKDPDQKEFLINLSKRIFSNPATKSRQLELRNMEEEKNRKRSLSAGRYAGLERMLYQCKTKYSCVN